MSCNVLKQGSCVIYVLSIVKCFVLINANKMASETFMNLQLTSLCWFVILKQLLQKAILFRLLLA